MKSSKKWTRTTNIYEVNIRQYTAEGTFTAFEKHLQRLQEMGVDTLWLMPITPISQKNKKGSMGSPYACSDYTSINPEFGDLEDFKHLVASAHRLGLKIIIDWVANHTGWDHSWTKTHPEYYLIDPETQDFQIASGMDDIIELDYSKAEVRKAMIDAMKFWVAETEIDGFRCDLASWVTLDFWKEAIPAVQEKKALFFLGEFDELENPEYGEVFDASYSWTWMHKTEDYYKNKLPLEELRDLLRKYSTLGDDSMRAWFTTNHDENSWNGTEYEKYAELALPLAVFSATWNGVPLLYSGQEMPNNKRLKFFEKDSISWTGKYEMAKFYNILLALKSTNPALRGGDKETDSIFLSTTAEDKILAFRRRNGADEVVVLLNMSREAVKFKITDEALAGSYQNLFEGNRYNFFASKDFDLKPRGYAVFTK